MIGSVVGNKDMIDGDGVVLLARLVEMSRLLSELPSKSSFYRATVSSHHPLVKSILITSDERLTEHNFLLCMCLSRLVYFGLFPG